MTFLGWQISFANIEELIKLRKYVSVVSYDGSTIYAYPDRITSEVKQAHRASVYHALNNGLDIPKGVKLEYPELFRENYIAHKKKNTLNHAIDMVAISGGTFLMGDVFGDGYHDETPVHEVSVDPFYLGQVPVTQQLWEEIMGDNPSFFKNGGDYPVEQVSWNDIQLFLEKLNNQSNRVYRLPTEAEWEFAARSGSIKKKYAGTNNIEELHKYAWYEKNSEGRTHPVGMKLGTSLGLYDMSGNVWEWCQDDYNPGRYCQAKGVDPAGSRNGEEKVLRGGSWRRASQYLRTVERGYFDPDLRFRCVGFRLASSFAYCRKPAFGDQQLYFNGKHNEVQ